MLNSDSLYFPSLLEEAYYLPGTSQTKRADNEEKVRQAFAKWKKCNYQ